MDVVVRLDTLPMPSPGHYKLFLEWLMVPSLAAGLTLPQAVFCYWCGAG